MTNQEEQGEARVRRIAESRRCSGLMIGKPTGRYKSGTICMVVRGKRSKWWNGQSPDRGHSTPCLIWQGSLNDRGYGMSSSGGRRLAHKVQWETVHGPVPDGLELDHLCRQRDCVNPAHLEPVTHAENMRRSSVARAEVAAAEGSRIAALRVRLQWSQGQLAEALGVSRALVTLWEGGRHRVADKYEPRLRELAEGYGHTPEPTYEQPIGVRAA